MKQNAEQNQESYLVHGVPVCTNSWNIMYSALAVLILQASDKRRVPWPTKLLRLVLRQSKSIMALKSCYTTRVYTRALQIWFAMHNGMETIVDFKQSNRPKKEEWIEDYYLQIAMYAMAHDYVYGSKIEQGVIMVCTPDLYYQEFKTEGADLRAWKHKALKTNRYV